METQESLQSLLGPLDVAEKQPKDRHYHIRFYGDDRCKSLRVSVVNLRVNTQTKCCTMKVTDPISIEDLEAIVRAKAFIEAQELTLR